MTDSITVAIPDDVKNNDTHTVRVVSNGVRAEEGGVSAADQLKYYLDNAGSLGYGGIEYEVTNNGNRAVVNEFWQNGRRIWEFRTEYYTRVPCARCPLRWAQFYVVVEQDGQRSEAEPLCGDHYSTEEIRVSRAQRAGIDLKLHRSEWLRVGQH